MIIHKYLEAKYGIEAIIDSKLKVSLPKELNDPFEFLPKDIGNWTKTKVKKYLKDKARQNRIFEYQKKRGIVKNKQQFKEALKNIDSLAEDLLIRFQSKDFWNHMLESKKDIDQYMRLICFSSEVAKYIDEILMWSHYSNKHYGIRLHYDSNLIMLPYFELRKVKYSKERPSVDYTLDNISNELTNQLMLAMHTKSECWEYEKEYRLFIEPNYCTNIQKDDNKYIFAEIPTKSLIRVDLGLKCGTKYVEEILLLKTNNQFSKVKFCRAELNKDEYRINYTEIN